MKRFPSVAKPLRAACAVSRGVEGWLPPSNALVPLLGLVLLVSGCTTTSQVSTRYYDVSGSTSQELDREIRRKGPRGGKAIATAGIDIRSVDLEPSVSGGLCRFRQVTFRVSAAIILPQWREATSSRDAELRRLWSGFSAYARAHEEAHVKIAEAFARAIEGSFLAIPPQPSCARLEAIALQRLRRAATLHEQVQLAFDAREQRRFAQIAAAAQAARASR